MSARYAKKKSEEEVVVVGGFVHYMYLHVRLLVSCVPVLSIQQKSYSLRKKVKMLKVCAWHHAFTTLKACSSQAADEANLPVGHCECDLLNLSFKNRKLYRKASHDLAIIRRILDYYKINFPCQICCLI